MGIRGLSTLMKDCPGCIRPNVKIADYVSKDCDNVIVVDGNQFFERYIYDRLEWLLSELRQLLEDIRMFVDSFRNIGVRLVFIFNHQHPPSTDERPAWILRRNENIEFTKQVLTDLEINNKVTVDRRFEDRLEFVKYFVYQALRNVMQCEVHFVIGGTTTKVITQYAVKEKCVALLSENSYFVFYEDSMRYLSIKNLDLITMKTVEYCSDALVSCLGLEKALFPLLATIVGENELVNSEHPLQKARNMIYKYINITVRDHDRSYIVKVSKYIMRNRNLLHDVPMFLVDKFGNYGNILVPAFHKFNSQFRAETNEDENCRHILQSNVPQDIPHMNPDILAKINEMLHLGEMCYIIHDIVLHKVFQQYIIFEDYKSLPASGLAYKPIRKKMYGILFHDSQTELKNIKVQEWCMDNERCPEDPCLVSPDSYDPGMHPGLLSLWDRSNVSEELLRMKRQLFLGAISPNLNINFCELPPTLVMPTVILYYMFKVMPDFFPGAQYEFIELWEVEVFLVQAIILPTRSVVDIAQLNCENCSARAVKLCSFFLSGYFLIHMLAQICGFPLAENDMLIFNYFDGKLFHYIYQIALQGEDINHLIPDDKESLLQSMKAALQLP